MDWSVFEPFLHFSFASGGDSDTLDYIAYVAKDGAGGRACYVLECSGGLAQDVITTIGQAFELRSGGNIWIWLTNSLFSPLNVCEIYHI